MRTDLWRQLVKKVFKRSNRLLAGESYSNGTVEQMIEMKIENEVPIPMCFLEYQKATSAGWNREDLRK